MSDKKEIVEKSNDLQQLYRILVAFQTNAIDYVYNGKTDVIRKERAKQIIQSLRQTNGLGGLLNLTMDEDKCWDPATQQWKDCLEA